MPPTTSNTTTVGIKEAFKTAKSVLQGLGWSSRDAEIQAEIMMFAERHGNNQGLVKLFDPQQMAPSSSASAPEIEKEGATSAVINGHQSPGMIALRRGIEVAREKAKNSGLAIVGMC